MNLFVKKFMEGISKNDFIYFRNEMLEDLNKLEQKLTSKISSSEKILDTFSTVTQHKLNMCQNKLNEISSIQNFDELKEQINNQISKFNLKFDDSHMRNELRISRMEKDLINFSFKYDKLFISNFFCPDLIGEGCEFNSLKAFFKYMYNKINDLIGCKNNTSSEWKTFKKTYKEDSDQFFNKINSQLEKNKLELKDLCLKEANLVENKCNDRIKCIEDKVEFIRMENGKYSFNIINNTEKLQDQLNEESKKFCEVNQNLIKFFNAQKKDLKKNTTITRRKSVASETLTNELLPALKNLQENLNFKRNAYEKKNANKNNIIEEINFEIKNDQNKKFQTASLHNSKKSLNDNFSIENINYEITNNNNKEKTIDKTEKKTIEDNSNVEKQIKNNNSSLFYNKKEKSTIKARAKIIFSKKKSSSSNTTENELSNKKQNINLFKQKNLNNKAINDNNRNLNNDIMNDSRNIIKSENIELNNSRKDKCIETNSNKTENNNILYKSVENLTKPIGENEKTEENIKRTKTTQKAINIKTNIEEEYNIPRLILSEEKQNKSKKTPILSIEQNITSENLQPIQEYFNKINKTINSFHQSSNEKFQKLSKEISYIHNEYKKIKFYIERTTFKPNSITFNDIFGKKEHNKTLTTFSEICFPPKQFSKSRVPYNKKCINLERRIKNILECDNSSNKKEENLITVLNRIEPYLIKKFKK